MSSTGQKQPILNISDDPLLRKFFLITAIVFTIFGLISIAIGAVLWWWLN